MPDSSPTLLRTELAWSRRVVCAAEIVDGVTFEPVRTDIIVRADGLKHGPFINRSGFYVWLEEGDAKPLRISVDASKTQYADADVAAPSSPQKSVRIELVPQFGYGFPAGATALRGTLLLSRFGARKPVAGTQVHLQWSGDNGWADAPTSVTTNDNGDFAVPLRFGPKDSPSVTNGRIVARLCATRFSVTMASDQFQLPRGQVTPAPMPFFWEDLHP